MRNRERRMGWHLGGGQEKEEEGEGGFVHFGEDRSKIKVHKQGKQF